jgi:CO/xanthine dehydrogenase FAD-binding subunit
MALSWRETGSDAAGAGATVPTWSDVRLALGSVADRPIRTRATEAMLAGATPTPATADDATETLAAEIVPIDDVRSTADYRRAVAARVLHRMIRDAGGW